MFLQSFAKVLAAIPMNSPCGCIFFSATSSRRLSLQLDKCALIVTRNITNVTTKAVLIAICGLFCALESSQVLAQTNQANQTQPFPYRAIVTGENAIVHSGPGKTHYGTDRLRPGMEVEVHRHDPGGWLAIRPPKKSFSLIQRDEIEIYENGLAKVTQQETVAWVGTRLNPVKKPMWQVKLRKGEMLEVLGIVDRDRFDLTEKEPDWVQVAPPAGEFRWIAASNIRPLNASDVPSRELDHAEISNFQIEAAEAGSNDSESLNGQSTPNHSSRPAPFDAWEPSQPDTNDWGVGCRTKWRLSKSNRTNQSVDPRGFTECGCHDAIEPGRRFGVEASSENDHKLRSGAFRFSRRGQTSSDVHEQHRPATWKRDCHG